jgi:hypothetical protein
MKATLLGAAVSKATLRSAYMTVVKSEPGPIREVGGRLWVELPFDVRQTVVSSLSTRLATSVTLIEVEMSLGARGADLTAERSVHPEGKKEDLSAEAKALLHDWLADTKGEGFDEDVAASELAWELIDSDLQPASAEGADVEARWATAFLERLRADEQLVLRGKRLPVDAVADVLASRGDDGDALSDCLLDAAEIDEVFAEPEQLAEVARETRPGRG